ncbi:MAG TPA: Bax inhibitor-1/YccA family protein, partial [Chitinophagaceae bacterium]|nr:Bax inhibitor-1/YccA family protein [Chitinophagaceae bacterium]
MALFNSQTGNPALNQKIFDSHPLVAGQSAMTFSGTINKFIFMFVMLAGASFYSWNVYSRGGNIAPLLWTGIIGGLVVAVIISLKMEWAQYLAPAYAILEGFFLGTISAALNNEFKVKAPFLVMQAVLLTFGVVLAMLALYKSGVIKVTKRYVMIVIGATAGIFVF